ncbi:glutathione S-transferase family protein [Brevundimonas goettingensis]|uniref:Glutathione S-transferase family protein n=1 Tax=Brevundimonas goettingensis TaxID=2774190 RepID=A0A975C1G7_9CAUL|nr:glutathione S-transferase family protein [Brevundimonas goettingensis]QTC90045.1 glutathione S-transferase family protein [Brevundimonas goettingensis]
MTLELFAHPFSSYCQKALIAFYENDIPFTYRMLEDPGVGEEFAALWPIKRFPILRDGERVVLETSVVIEYLAVHYPGPVRLIPEDADLALEVRMLDRFFDNYVMTPQGDIVFESLRPAEARDPYGADQARKMLETSYAWLDDLMKDRTWAVGETFTLADCAAAPSLFYADWTHRIPEQYVHLLAYRARLLQRPSFARAVDEARRFRHYFPLGAPDRD